MTKTVILVIHADDARKVVSGLSAGGFNNTYFYTTGGFAARENVTIMCAVDGEKVDRMLKIVRQNIKPHRDLPTKEIDGGRITTGAVAFVIPLERFERLTADEAKPAGL